MDSFGKGFKNTIIPSLLLCAAIGFVLYLLFAV